MLNDDDLNQLIEILTVEELLPFSEEVTTKLYIPESKGFYSLYKTPFFKPLFDYLENPNVEVLSLKCSSQLGKSQFLAAVAIAWAARYPGELVLIYTPDNQNAENMMAKKIIPSIEQSLDYENLLLRCSNGEIDRSSITKKSIKFSNGSEIQCLGIAGKTSRRSKTSSLVILDEYSMMSSNRKDGDILSQAITRTTAKSYGNRKVLVASTPLMVNEDIDRLYKQSKQISWEFPCPECGKYQILDFQQLKFEKDETVDNNEYSDKLASGKLGVWYECPNCSHRIEEQQKPILLNRGREVVVGNQNLSDKKISIGLNGLYSLEKWTNIASKYIQTIDDIEKSIEFKQQTLAEPWAVDLKSKNLQKEQFDFGEYPKGIAPPDTYKLVAAIDIQGGSSDSRYYWAVLAYTHSKKIYLIDWDVEYYDLTNVEDPEAIIYQLEDKIYSGFPIAKVLVDCGFNQDQNVKICKSLKRTQGIKGFKGAKYTSTYFTKLRDEYLKFIPKNLTNELLDVLAKSKTFLLPAETSIDDEILDHLTNVFRNHKGEYLDRSEHARRDWRDCIRYALAFIKQDRFQENVEEQKYRQENKEEIEIKRRQNRARLNKMFSR